MLSRQGIGKTIQLLIWERHEVTKSKKSILTKKKIQDTIFKLAQSKVVSPDIVLTKDMPCVDAEIDSLDLIEISYEVEELYEVDIDPANMAFTDQTIGDLVDTLCDIILAGKKNLQVPN